MKGVVISNMGGNSRLLLQKGLKARPENLRQPACHFHKGCKITADVLIPVHDAISVISNIITYFVMLDLLP